MRKTHFAGIMSSGHSQDSFPQGIPKQRQAPMKQEGTRLGTKGENERFGCNGYDRDADSRKLRLRSNPSAKNKKKRPDTERERDRLGGRVSSTCLGPLGSCLARTLTNRDVSRKSDFIERNGRAPREPRGSLR